MSKLISKMLLLIVFVTSSAWSTGNDQLWEITTRVDMTGMEMPEVTRTVCQSVGDPYNPGKIPHQRHCQHSDIKVTAGTTTWNVRCRGREPMEGSGIVVQDEKSLSGTMSLRSNSIEMHQVISGKLVGTCSK